MKKAERSKWLPLITILLLAVILSACGNTASLEKNVDINVIGTAAVQTLEATHTEAVLAHLTNNQAPTDTPIPLPTNTPESILVLSTESEMSIQDSGNEFLPVMEGTDVRAIAKKAKEFGMSEPFGDEDFGHGTKQKSITNDSNTLMIEIIYSSYSGEILCASVITSPLASESTQRNFVLSMADVLCPPKDVDKVMSWINENIGKKESEEINGFEYALSFGPKNNLLYDVGMTTWGKWESSFN